MERMNYQDKGLNVFLLKTDKFKTTDVIINFSNYLNEENVTTKALVPYILKSACENYPNKKSINKHLEHLYGATFGVAINKQGLLQILSFRMSLINDTYLTTNQSLLDDAFKFLNEILFKPKLENGTFSENVVNEEKRLLKDHFKSRYNNKVKYSYDKLIEEMFKNEIYRINALGRIEDIEKINAKNLFETYQEMMKNDTVDLLIIGDIDNQRIKKLINDYLHFENRDINLKVLDNEDKEINEVNKIFETQNINQAKLNIGLRTYTRGLDNDYPALVIMNAMFGLYPHSLLFKNVREKESLCYYISSNIDKAKGVMVIYAGINQSDYDKVVDIIFKQLDIIKNGQFEDDLIKSSRKALINDLLESSDNPLTILASEYSYRLYEEVYDVNTIINKLNNVTRQQIIDVANKIKEDTIFLLKGEDK